MAKERPWNRAEYTTPPAQDGLNLGNASDEEVRAYCLQRSRAFLARAETTEAAISSGRQLEIAAQYAIIAQAFRPGPQPE
ncbi:hypothetical protein ACF090_32400 [Streptomyces sp. NPDC014892]|uniref:hypothetical protein n=1 Tax=Streptomyces TaxID=1883 RepID=UPI001EFB977E|nr:hypothetical protein [Streptomyces deccanensis]ULR51573.1 hypothetical protein L3078_20935 [Streptomyces deccanensis]